MILNYTYNSNRSFAAFKTTPNPRVNRFRRNVNYDKSYLDYMSDEDFDQLLIDEAFPSEASSEEYDTEESSDLSNNENKSMYKTI